MTTEKFFQVLPAILFMVGLLILTYFIFWGPESAYERDMRLQAESIKSFQERVDRQHNEMCAKIDKLDEGITEIGETVGRIRSSSSAGLADIRLKLTEIEANNAKIADMSDAELAARVRLLVDRYRKDRVHP